MKTDSYFEIGSSHTVCQDFALTGSINNVYFAIISDGCTESHKKSGEVDLGARILTYAARKTLKTILPLYSDLSAIQPKKFSKELRDSIIAATLKVGEDLGLCELFADATLVIAITDGKIVLTFTYGDGGIIVCKSNGDIIYREISFLSSAPYYLIYTQNKNRNDGYKVVFGGSPALISTYRIDGVSGEDCQANEVINTVDENIYDKMFCSFDDFVSISITSDGIKSYEQMANPIKSIELVKEFVSFKNQNNGFLQRRFNFLKKDHKEKNITHFDDVSVATILK